MSDEPGFDKLQTWSKIEQRLQQVALHKCRDVLGHLKPAAIAADRRPPQDRSGQDHSGEIDFAAVITADTVIVAQASASRLAVLGQPPDDDSWADVVRGWFRRYYFGRTHTAATAVCVATPAGATIERLVKSDVTFRSDGERWLEWYIATGEPRGKAGGYAIQQAGSVFVQRVEGSLSNVIGLPLEVLLELSEELSLGVSA